MFRKIDDHLLGVTVLPRTREFAGKLVAQLGPNSVGENHVSVHDLAC